MAQGLNPVEHNMLCLLHTRPPTMGGEGAMALPLFCKIDAIPKFVNNHFNSL